VAELARWTRRSCSASGPGGMAELLAASVRAAVLASERELIRWFSCGGYSPAISSTPWWRRAGSSGRRGLGRRSLTAVVASAESRECPTGSWPRTVAGVNVDAIYVNGAVWPGGAADSYQPGEWIRAVGGWHPSQFTEGRSPARGELDDACQARSGHLAAGHRQRCQGIYAEDVRHPGSGEAVVGSLLHLVAERGERAGAGRLGQGHADAHASFFARSRHPQSLAGAVRGQ